MKMRLAVFTVAVALLASTAAAQQFPRLQEENLAGQQVVLPDAAAGKIAVLVLGFSHASGTPTGAWAKRATEEFGKNPGFVLYQLAVIEDAPRLVRGMITSGMKKGVPDSQRATFIPVVHEEAALKTLVGYKEEDYAYIVVLDRGGKVVYQTHAATVDPGYAELRAKLAGLLK